MANYTARRERPPVRYTVIDEVPDGVHPKALGMRFIKGPYLVNRKDRRAFAKAVKRGEA